MLLGEISLSLSDSLNSSLSAPLPRILPIPVVLPTIPPLLLWAKALTVKILIAEPVGIVHAPLPPADLRRQHGLPALQQAFGVGLFFQRLLGL